MQQAENVATGTRLVTVKVAPFNAESSIEELGADITPTAGFYVRSNFKVPIIAPDAYRLRVGGLVDRPLELSLTELKALGTRTITTTMECAGNNRMSLAPLPSGEPWLGGAVSTGRWTGVPLASVLAKAGLQSNSVEILVEGADRGKPKDGPADIPFARGLPTDKALHPETLLAFDMNGEPLTIDHGAPIRLVVPTWYGMAAVKWVTAIEAIAEPFTGYYQKNRYILDWGNGEPPPPVTTMMVKSIVTAPHENDIVPVGPLKIEGKTWSGVGAITRVEVAIDGAETWQDAQLTPASGPYTWQSWSFQWAAAEPGRHAIRCRATDDKGNIQPAMARWNKYGYCSNGVQVTVVNTR